LLVGAKSGTPNQFRFVVFDGRRGVALCRVSDGKLREKKWLVHFSGFWYISVANPALSPNGRWIYLPLHADTAIVDLQTQRLHWLGRARRLPDGGYIAEVYRLCWSPDSRYLLGTPGGVAGELILCQPLQQGYRVLVKGDVYGYGWYPDAQHIWFVKRGVDGQFHWYRRNLRSGQVKRLGASERRRINTDWDMTLSPFRWLDVPVMRMLKPSEWTPRFVAACTAQRQVRVRFDRQAPNRRLFIEWRNGRSVKLEAPLGVHRMFLWDLSANHQWALVVCSEQGGSRWYLVDLNRDCWEPLVFSVDVEQAITPSAGAVIRAEFEQSARLLFG
jgi:hypothetical protein